MSAIRQLLAFVATAIALVAVPQGASAAIVTNGDFETGTFSGWQIDNSPSASGNWFVYQGTTSPTNALPVSAPPQGKYAAITDMGAPGRHILYQDITVPTGGTQNPLTLFVYYRSSGAITSPDTLSTGVPNQQYRIDVMRPSAAIDSVASGDVLLTVFRTVAGDPTTLAPTLKTADLTAFAGQVVRLRLAEVDNLGPLNASADAISVKTNAFTIGTVTRNKKKGIASVPLTLPDPGDVTVSGKGVKGRVASASTSTAVGAGAVNVRIKAKGKKKRKLNQTGKVKLKVKITYTPSGVSPNTRTLKVKLKKKLKR